MHRPLLAAALAWAMTVPGVAGASGFREPAGPSDLARREARSDDESISGCWDYTLSAHPLGYVPLAEDVCLSGELAFIARRQRGLTAADISDPFASTVLDSLGIPGSCIAVDAEGSWVYVLSVPDGLHIVDASDPTDQVLVGTLPAPAAGIDVAVEGSRVLVLDGAMGLLVVDVSVPSAPSILGQTIGGLTPTSVASAGTHAYVTDAASGLLSFDLTDPALPALIGFAPAPAAQHAVVSGSHAFVAADASGLRVVDVSSPGAISVVGSLPLPARALGVHVDGASVYVGTDSAGVAVVDVSTPSAPALLRMRSLPHPAPRLVARGDWALAATLPSPWHCYLGPEEPTVSPPVVTAAQIRSMVADGPYLYLLTEAGSFEILDAEAAHGPAIVGAVSVPGDATRTAMAVAGSRAYLVTPDALQVVDVSNPAAPSLRGSVAHPTPYSRGVAARGHHVFVTRATGQWYGVLTVFDAEDPWHPVPVTTVSTRGLPGGGVAQGDHLYMGMSGGVAAINVSDPSRPVFEGGAGAYLTGFAVGGRTLVTEAQGAIGLYDLTDPGYPVLRSRMDWTGTEYPGGLSVRGSYVYAATQDPSFGLRVIHAGDLSAPYHCGGLDPEGAALRVKASSRYLFVLNRLNSVVVAPLQCDPQAVPVPEVAVAEPGSGLGPGVPNPFAGSTAVTYSIRQPGPARLDVYDVLGRHVRSLVDQHMATPGAREASWDGRDAHGRPAAPGVYFLKLRTAGSEAATRVVRVR